MRTTEATHRSTQYGQHVENYLSVLVLLAIIKWYVDKLQMRLDQRQHERLSFIAICGTGLGCLSFDAHETI
ncbi:hypothetical protein OUZ56_027079 [Daphnia magna]|uniref:Uncharacterized protein n=1 Tax=Daphnia magna TaxID=35525 RepID=A0ABQ9ZNP6_9CRUS|nr:hypothetical protein OUZ56_027079 [Daphnia magna]